MNSTTLIDSDPHKGSLKQRLLGAARWTLAGHFLAQLLRFGSNLVLTRWLAPDLFGVMSIGYTIFTALAMVSDLGLGAVVARSHRGDERTFLNVVWVTQIGRGVLITFGALALSVALWLGVGMSLFPAHSVYADPRLPTLVAVLSLYGIVEGFESTKSLWARRNLSLAALTKIELICQLMTTVFILTWASIDPSIWALGAGLMFGAGLRTVLSHTALPGPSNRIEWDRKAFDEIIAFGKWALVSSPISFMLTSGDRILLGALLDAANMGFYAIAMLFTVALQTVILKIVGHSVLPALSEVARTRPADLRKTMYRVRLPLDAICLVAAGLLFVLGEPIVHLLYDPRYAPAGWMLSVISLSLAFTQLSVFDQCLMAIGRNKLLGVLNAIRLVTLYGLILLGYHFFGARGAIAGVPLAALVNAFASLAMQGRFGLIEIKREALMIPFFGAGLLAGWLARMML